MKSSLAYKVNATIMLSALLVAATFLHTGNLKATIYFSVVAIFFAAVEVLLRGFSWLFEQLFPTTEETEEK